MNSLAPLPRLDNHEALSLGYCFIGLVIAECAKLDRWATKLLAATGSETEAPRLFGEKLKAVRLLAERGKALPGSATLADAPAVRDLLKRFEPYADLRSRLAHSVVTFATRNDGYVFVYDPVDRKRHTWSIAFSEAAQVEVSGEIRRLVRKLAREGLRETARPAPSRPCA
jgi:hypothetical protein